MVERTVVARDTSVRLRADPLSVLVFSILNIPCYQSGYQLITNYVGLRVVFKSPFIELAMGGLEK